MSAPDTGSQETQQVPAIPAGLEGISPYRVAESPETNKEPFVSYSLNFEDVVLHRLFSRKQIGFYVDVGAGHPRFENDMFALYQRGWRGINIEPNHGFHAALTEERPRDTNLRVALSDRVGRELTYYELNGSGLSTCDPEQARIYQASSRSVVIREVPVTTLTSVLEEAGVAHINILKIDVEGFEEKVLNGNDWERFRPDVVVIEATYPESPIRRPTNILSFMEQRGYRRVHFDGLNDFYLEREFATPEGLTLPPNVFDRFVACEVVELRNQVASLQAAFTAVEDCARSLQAENGRIGHENAHLSLENRRLSKSAEQMRAELLTLNRLLEPLHAMSEQLEQRDVELREVHARMSEQLEQRDVELREVHARLQGIYTSNSWFLTKPWRFAGRLINRFFPRGLTRP
jgi:FkbM family methyltransferase